MKKIIKIISYCIWGFFIMVPFFFILPPPFITDPASRIIRYVLFGLCILSFLFLMFILGTEISSKRERIVTLQHKIINLKSAKDFNYDHRKDSDIESSLVHNEYNNFDI